MNDDVKKISGKFYWARFYDKNELSDAYQFDFGNLSEGAVKWLESKEIDVKNKGDDRGFFVTYKSKNYPFKPLDDDATPLDPEILVGNGSEGVVVTGLYAWKFKNKKGVSASAKKIIVTKVKEYKKESILNEENDIDEEEVL